MTSIKIKHSRRTILIGGAAALAAPRIVRAGTLQLLGVGPGAVSGGSLSPVVHQAADSTPTACTKAVPSNSTAITVPAGLTNGLLLVGVEWDAGSAVGITGVTWNGTAMERAVSQLTSDNATLIEEWGLRNPAAGTNTIEFTWNSGANTVTTRAQFCGTSWSNVNQGGGTATYGTPVTNTGTSNLASVNATGNTTDQIVAMHGFTLANNGGAGINQTLIASYDGSIAAFAMNRAAGTGSSLTFSAGTAGNPTWASIAAILKPAA